MRTQWDNKKESLVKAAPSCIWMAWSIFMHSHLIDINKLLLMLAEATQSWEFLYWLLNQQNSWLSASSSSLTGNMQQHNLTFHGRLSLQLGMVLFVNILQAWEAIPAARIIRNLQYLTALANENSSKLQAHIHMHLTEREQFNSLHYYILLTLRIVNIVLLSANPKISRQFTIQHF